MAPLYAKKMKNFLILVNFLILLNFNFANKKVPIWHIAGLALIFSLH